MLFQTALVAMAATVVNAVKPLIIDGQNFVDPDTGAKFQVVGMAYQPGGSAGYHPDNGYDPLTDADICKRDAALMQILGINAIRVYNINPDLNHDECASIFNAAGMYMMIDVNSPLPGESIPAAEPWTGYFDGYMNRTFAIVEGFSNYNNTLLFFSANEVIDDEETAEFAPQYLRAVIRDLKNYINNNIERKIPVGYSAADVRRMLWDTYNYLQCSEEDEDDDISRADLFALNSYSWCGPDATFESSSFDDLVEGFDNASHPIFFSEYGCNEDLPRLWREIQSIYGEDMKDTFSGGVVYEYTMEKNNYGLVNISGDTLTILSDFNRLRGQLEEIDWEELQSETNDKDYDPPTCRSSLIRQSGFDSNFTLPDMPPNVAGFIRNGISNAPRGRFVDVSDLSVSMEVIDADGNTMSNLTVQRIANDEFNWSGKNAAETGTDEDDGSGSNGGGGSSSSDDDDDDDDDEDAAVLTKPMMWAVGLPLLAMLFA